MLMALAVQVAALGVPYVLMHMRGTPATMQQQQFTQYTDVTQGQCVCSEAAPLHYPCPVPVFATPGMPSLLCSADVAAELEEAGERAMAAGIEPWRLILDPGLGFAKTQEDNLRLMAQLRRLRAALRPPLSGMPLMLGPSRKGFLGRLTGGQHPTIRWQNFWAQQLCLVGGC